MTIEKIKISELTQTNTKGLVIVSVLEGGVYKTYAYDLNNITNAVKGATFAGFVQCTTYLGGYVNPFLDFGATDKFFYVLKGNGIAGFLDDGGGQHTYTQTNVQTTIVYWNGSAYSSEVVADSSVTTGSEVFAPHYVRSGYSTMGGEAVEHFDLSRYPICVRTWQEFKDTLESGAQYINIYVAQDLTAPATSPMQISIADTTEVININGCNIIDVDGLVLDSISRSEPIRIVVNNTITLKSTYNPLDYTGDKGSITFNIDQDVDMYIGGEVSGNFVKLTNTQATAVTIHGNILEEYGGKHAPTDITGNIIIVDNGTQDLDAKADKVTGATNGDLAGLDASGNLTDSGIGANNVMQKVAGATNGNVATLNASGEAVDSGKALSALANDADVVHKTGAETVSGVKNFSNGLQVSGQLLWYDTTNQCMRITFN